MRLLLAMALLAATPLCAATYNVGPGQTFANIGDVSWETLVAGDIVRIRECRPISKDKKFFVEEILQRAVIVDEANV